MSFTLQLWFNTCQGLFGDISTLFLHCLTGKAPGTMLYRHSVQDSAVWCPKFVLAPPLPSAACTSLPAPCFARLSINPSSHWSHWRCLQLVEVINQDYNDFVSLSTKLVNVDGAVLRMQRPLQVRGHLLLSFLVCFCMQAFGRV